MANRKVAVVVTARPSYSRVRSLLKALDASDVVDLQLVVASSALLERYGSAVDIIRRDGFKIDATVFNVVEGANPTVAGKTTGIGIMELSTVFENLKPDIVVTIADRFETMATAVAAAYMNIPLAHIQGGEVTGNIDEKVRHSITKLADYHFVASDSAKQRVLRLGEHEDSVFNTGCPSIDLASEALAAPTLSFDPYQKYGGVGKSQDLGQGYIVVLQHPVTSEYQQAKHQVQQTLAAVSAESLPSLWFWPNVDTGADATSAGIRAWREQHDLPSVHFFKNMEPQDFLNLLINCRVLVGNSSVGIRECAFLGVPVVNIGTRQARRDRGFNVIDVGYGKNEISSAIHHWLSSQRPKRSDVYGGGSAGNKIADLLTRLPLRFTKQITF